MKFTWEEKLEILQAAGGTDISPIMRRPGDWYCGGMSIVNGGFLVGGGGNGTTPQEAVEDAFHHYCEEGHVIKIYSPDKKSSGYIKWNGFMWKEVERPA